MPPKTITTDTTNVLFKIPSVSDISFTDATITTTTAATITRMNVTTGDIRNTLSYFNSLPPKEVTLTIKTPEFHPEWNCRPDELKKNNPLIGYFRTKPAIVNINIIVPNKVVEVIIFDGEIHTYKQVCKYPDDFDLTFALALAWTKYKNEVFKLDYTLEGIEDAAHEYMWKYRKPLKEFNRAIKAYNKWFKEETRKEAEEEERQAIIERRRAKNKKRKEKMRARKKQEEISTIAEAIKKAKEN